MFKRVIKEEHKVPANVNYLGEMRDFITRIGRKYGVSERIINAFKLAIDEAGTNIIRYAYRDWEGFITIRMIIREQSVTVLMIDQGHAFDPRKVRDPNLRRYVDIGKKGGLGIFIIRRVIDSIDYHKTVEGNELRLTKKREATSRRGISVPEISITMKTRFSLIASGILSFLVLTGFLWNYIQQDGKIVRDNLESGRALARSMAHSCLDYLAEEATWELAKIAAEFQRDHAPFITDALIVDTTGIIQGAVRTDRIFESFVMPPGAVEKAKDVFEYTLSNGTVVYDLAKSAIPAVSGIPRPIGTIHLLINKAAVDRKIALARKRSVWTFGMILLLGYLGIFVLVYVTMSPFKKLANWVKALGRDEAQQEMDFDASDEIGEIAKAFNEITEKFRKSQENLAEQERLQKEMQVAQEIQQTLLPSAFPEIEGYEIASYYEAAKEVGGDYFDFVEVDKDTLGIVVADVSGKGVPGSLIMTMIRTALRTEARGNKNAADVLARVNDFVINDMKRGMFVTVFYIILDSHARTINYASAGHNPMILYRGETKKSFYLNPRGFPIGINLPDNSLFRNSIQSDTLHLHEGDVLLVYTDGITEAMNIQRERFGEERFLSVIRKYADMKVDPLVDNIRAEISTFTEGYAQNDDITLVAIKEKMKAEDVLFNLRTRLMQIVNNKEMSVKEACKSVGVSTSTYYKYKKRFDKIGVDGLKEKVLRSEIEEKHISIEDKVKIYDIIKQNPEFGAKRISEELNTEKYNYTEIDEKKLYDEFVKSHLNTKELRLAYIERGGKRQRMKPPGTPFLALDGQVIFESKMKPAVPLPAYPTETEGKKKPPFEIRVSQFPQEEMDEKKEMEEIEGEKTTVLDEFLGFGELPPIPLDESETVSEEIEKREKPIFEDAETDHILDDLVMEDHDKFEIDKEDILSSADDLSLEQIMEMGGEELSEDIEDDQVENHITASIAGELLGEEMGLFEEASEKEEDDASKEEGFLEMMEGLGFDRRTVLSDGKKKRDGKPSDQERDSKRKKYLESGLWFYRQGFYLKAVEELKKAIEEDPDFIEAHQCLGDTLFRLGQLDEAKNAYDKVRKLDPENLNVLENLGVIFANRGDYKKAVWQWGEVLKHNPDRRDIIDRIKKMQRVIRQRYL